MTPLSDLAAFVDVRLRATGNPAASCAGIWFRFDTYSGYLLRICADGITLAKHRSDRQPTIEALREWRDPLAADAVVRVGVAARGGEVTVYRDGQPLGSHTGAEFSTRASKRRVLTRGDRDPSAPRTGHARSGRPSGVLWHSRTVRDESVAAGA